MADQLTDKDCREIMALVQIREALGDPLGRLMQDELVQLAKDTVAERDRLRAELARAHEARRQAQSELAYVKARLASARLILMRELTEQGWVPPNAVLSGCTQSASKLG